MMYKIAERFKSLQGEGVYTGTPMAFIRFVGCSVGKTVCQHCDTDFDKVGPGWRGGGSATAEQLAEWAEGYDHVCLTGGEPLDQDLDELFGALFRGRSPRMVHIETSGTKEWKGTRFAIPVWLCVSPKPGFREDMIKQADEVKVIVPGLGDITPKVAQAKGMLYMAGPEGLDQQIHPDFYWPDLSDAIRWANEGKTVFIQPRNGKFDIEKQNLLYCLDVLKDHPELRLSTQMHKILKVQ